MTWLVFMCLMPLLPFATIYLLKLNERAIDAAHAREKKANRDNWMLHNFGIKPTDVLSDSAAYNFHEGLVAIVGSGMARLVIQHDRPYQIYGLLKMVNSHSKTGVKTDANEQAKALYQSCLFDSQMQNIIEK